MNEFLTDMAEILEEDAINPGDELDSFESWDSLATLSVISMADEKFGVTLTAQEVNRADTVEELYQLITTKQAA